MCLLGRAQGDGETLCDGNQQEAEGTGPDVRSPCFNDLGNVRKDPKHIFRQQHRHQKKQDTHTEIDGQGKSCRPADVHMISGPEKLRHERGVSAGEPEDQHPENKIKLH